MQLRLVLNSYKSPPDLTINGNSPLPTEPVILEYTDPELRTRLHELLELERTTIASRKEVLAKLVKKFNAAIGPLSEATMIATLASKYPEYFI